MMSETIVAPSAQMPEPAPVLAGLKGRRGIGAATGDDANIDRYVTARLRPTK